MPDYLEGVRQNRNMPWLRRGMACNFNGEDGKVTDANSSGYVLVKVPGQRPYPCHPHWRMTYYSSDGSVIADYKTKEEK